MGSSSQAAPAFVRLAAHPLRWRLLTALAAGDLRVRELTALVDAPQNAVSYHLRLLREGGLVAASRSSFDGRDSYYRLDLDQCAQALADTGAVLHPALRPAPPPPAGPRRWPRVSVLFACTGNSARSPIAEALLRHHTAGGVTVASAGSRPRPSVHPQAVRVLREEYGIDIAGRRPRHLDTLRDQRFDYVITLCDKVREVCPEFGGDPRRVHWSIGDPAAGPAGRAEHAAFARAGAVIDARVRHLLPVIAQTSEAHHDGT
ncbi:metalloregulator ArsR/SmtB family transcription factor [Actinomadura madurae]|uniref:metalloregulator ArsR/SmtB family transcription factor n=1 Tax=Actinomadura madurae TaxID=1993 RepID=UPI00202737A3|nr:metalloregulator ArsR/SmtB family transcription factor [Actinomadura madurae]URN03969.1 metalloregulator ArsR/SmtB family transcription factor [Actinomadura madurae]